MSYYLSEESHQIIRDLTAQGFGRNEISKASGVNIATVSKIARGLSGPPRAPDADPIQVDWDLLEQLRERRKEREASRKLSPDQVREIFLSTEGGPTLARRYGVGRTTIYQIRYRTSWRSVTEGLERPERETSGV